MNQIFTPTRLTYNYYPNLKLFNYTHLLIRLRVDLILGFVSETIYSAYLYMRTLLINK